MDEPVNVDLDPEEALRILLGTEADESDPDEDGDEGGREK